MTNNLKWTIGALALSFALAGCGGAASGAASAAKKACQAVGEDMDVKDKDIKDGCKCVAQQAKALVKKDPDLGAVLKRGAKAVAEEEDFDVDTMRGEYDGMEDYLEDSKEDKNLLSTEVGASLLYQVMYSCDDVRDEF